MAFDFDPAVLFAGTADGASVVGSTAGWDITGTATVTTGPGGVKALTVGPSSTVTRTETRPAAFTWHLVGVFDPTAGVSSSWPQGIVQVSLSPDDGAPYAAYLTVRDPNNNRTLGTSQLTAADFADGAVHVFSVTRTGTGVDLYFDGAKVATAPIATLNPTASPLTAFATTDVPATLSRVVGTDAAYDPADVDALLATYNGTAAPEPVEVGGSTTVTVGGTGDVVDTDVYDTPLPPTPTGDGGSSTPPVPPEAQAPPPNVPPTTVQRRSEIMPAPTLDGRGFPVDWAPSSLIAGDAGAFQVVVEGVDVTYLLGVPLPTPSWSRADPFGPATASIRIPQLTAFHAIGMGDLAWCRGGANVDIRLGGVSLFEGVVISFGHDEQGNDGTFTLTCLGALYQADLQVRKPAFDTTPQDMGSAITTELNTVISRRYAEIPARTLGVATSTKGGWDPKLTGRVQQMLATALTNGQQWTVTCVGRAPALVLKDTSTPHWHVSNGQRGVGINVSQDWSQAPNVIYGEGIAPDGGRWRNSKYPGWRPDDTPAYPFNDPNQTIVLGTTDAQTSTGTGVSVWQQRVGQPVTGYFSTSDRARLRSLQDAAGIQVDGLLGPQSWVMSFGTGSNTGNLEGPWIAPLAEATQVRPRLYGIDGADLGPNPEYDPRVLRVETYINFGEGVTKAEGVRAAQEMLARDMNPGWTGRITLTGDPEEGSRFLVMEGQNVAVRYWRGGGDLLLHVVAVDHSEDSSVLTVDSKARDYPTVDAIRARERDAVDPARAYLSPKGRSHLPQDTPTFDAEAGGGLVPELPLFDDLWTVIKIPVAAYGRIVKTDFQTTAATPFCLAVFDRPVTARDLLNLVGNPLFAETNPWDTDILDQWGLLMSWGWAKQPAGFYPGFYSTPDGEAQSPPTGRLLDTGTVEYHSTQAPWLWVAMIAQNSCFIRGRFYGGAD